MTVCLFPFCRSAYNGPNDSFIFRSHQLVSSSGLISISGWFVLERWTFLTQKDQKWLEEVISEILNELAKLAIVRAYRLAMQWCSRRLSATRASLVRLLAWLAAVRLPMSKGVMRTPDGDVEMGPARQPSVSSEGPGSSDGHKPKRDTHLLLDVRDPRVRFQNAVRAVIKLQRTTPKRGTLVRPGLPRRDSWWQTSMTSGPATAVSPVPDPGLWALRGARVPKVIEELEGLDLTQELSAHGALVRHIQFSPNGKYLATSRWGVFSLCALGMYLTSLLCFFPLAFYQLGQDCSALSRWGELCAVYLLFTPFARLWFIDRVLLSCRRHSRIIVPSCTSVASSVKLLGRLPHGSKREIGPQPRSGHPTVAISLPGSHGASSCGPRQVIAPFVDVFVLARKPAT